MTAADLEALAARVEAAEGASRELDAEVLVALDIRPGWMGKEGELWIDRSSPSGPVVRWNSLGRRSSGNPPADSPPAYTSSLDAAMQLAEGMEPEDVSEAVLPAVGRWIIGGSKTGALPRFLTASFLHARALATMEARRG
ncbi:MAG TPA: hypothetical protein VD768_08765 [Sphingomicrobium sp.]|nr:hypothetical protein [Sphingomicrobium sp.]